MLISNELLTDEAKDLKIAVRQFCKREFKDTLKWDESQNMPYELWGKMGDIGLTGMMIDADLGGIGPDALLSVVIMEEMAVYSPGIAMSLGAHSILTGNVINRAGSKEQKAQFLPDIASGKKIAAICITEPERGSDAAHPKTRAIKNGDKYLLRGQKIFITNAPVADIFVVYADTIEDGKSVGVSAFVVEKSDEITVDKMHKMGMRASPTGIVYFDDVPVPKENILRGVGEGLHIMMEGLDAERIGLSGENLGMIKGSLDVASGYAKERIQFDKPIISYQLIEEKLAYMLSELELNRTYLYTLANLWNKNKGDKKLRTATAISKIRSAEAAVKCAEEAIQVLGGYGYTSDYYPQMYWRDAKLYTIGAGTSEMMKLLIARRIAQGFNDL